MSNSDQVAEAHRVADANGVVVPVEHDRPETEDLTPERTFRRSVGEGRRRLGRGTLAMASTGLVGGIDVGTGVLGLLLVEQSTGSKLLGGLAFGIGFLALALARGELFTEDLLVPVTAVVARKSRIRQLPRLWAVTGVTNLVGGWVITGFIVSGLPALKATAIVDGQHYVNIGLGTRAFSLAVLGGTVITLMTWMQHSTDSVGAKVVSAFAAAFLLVAGGLDHAIVASLVMFAALHTDHAPFGYLAWAETAAWATLGNLVGGLGLVTILRIFQVPHRVAAERGRPEV